MATRAKCAFIDDIAEEEQGEADDVTEDEEGEDSDVGEEHGETDEDNQVDDKHTHTRVKKRIHQDSMDFYRQQLFLDTLTEEDKLLCVEDALLDQVGETSETKTCEDAQQKSNKRRRRRILIPEIENESN